MRNLSLLSLNQVTSLLESKLKNGWVVLAGDPNVLKYIEDNVYTPGTPDNADYEILFYPPIAIALGKKTKKLCDIVQVPDWELTLELNFVLTKGNKSLTEQVLANPDRDDAVQEYVKHLMKVVK